MFWHVFRAEWTKFWSVPARVLVLFTPLVATVVLSLLVVDVVEGGSPMFSYRLVHQPVTGDGTVVARVVAQDSHEASAAAGIIMKESTARTAPYAALFVSPGRGVRMHTFRLEQGGSATTGARWLKLTRTGDVITGYESADGTTWSQVGTITLRGLPARVEAGLLVASGTRTDTSARFDNVSVFGSGSASWSDTDVGVPGDPGGRFTENADEFTVTGSGAFPPFDAYDPHLADSGVVAFLFGLPVAIGLGVVFITSEYGRGMTIRTTFAAVPRRGRVLAAKALVLATAVFAVEFTACAFMIVRTLSNVERNGIAPASYLDQAAYMPVVGTALLLTAIALLSLGIGAIVRRSAGAIGLAMAVLLVPAILAENLPPRIGTWVVRPAPVSGFSIVEVHDFQTIPPPPRPPSLEYLPAWAGFAVLCAWIAVALGGALWLLRRRDA